MRLLITRPEPDAGRSATALRNRGHQVLVAPLMLMEPTETRLGLGPYCGVVATSGNALRAISKHPRRDELLDLILVTVGHRTAQVGREVGFRDVRSADGDARDLVALAAHAFRGTTRQVLYLAGEDQAADIAGLLARQGLKARTAITYKMNPVSELPQAAAAALRAERIDGVLHYSRRTAETYVRCADAADMRRDAMAPVHYCLSHEVGTALQAGGARDLLIAERPDETAMFRLLDGG